MSAPVCNYCGSSSVADFPMAWEDLGFGAMVIHDVSSIPVDEQGLTDDPDCGKPIPGWTTCQSCAMGGLEKDMTPALMRQEFGTDGHLHDRGWAPVTVVPGEREAIAIMPNSLEGVPRGTRVIYAPSGHWEAVGAGEELKGVPTGPFMLCPRCATRIPKAPGQPRVQADLSLVPADGDGVTIVHLGVLWAMSRNPTRDAVRDYIADGLLRFEVVPSPRGGSPKKLYWRVDE